MRTGQPDTSQTRQPRDDAEGAAAVEDDPVEGELLPARQASAEVAAAGGGAQPPAAFVPRGRVAQFAGAPDPDERLSQAARDLILDGVPENTQATYRVLWWVYVRWCGDMTREHLPATPETIVEFVNHLATERRGRRGRPLSPATIRSYLAVISVAHTNAPRPERDNEGRRLRGYVSPTKAIEVRRALKGHTRRYLRAGHRADQATALKPWELEAMVATLDVRSPVGLVKAVAFCDTYDAGFRRSELFAVNWEDVEVHVADPDHVRGEDEVEEEGAADHLVIHVPMSKTDQEGRGDEVVLYAHPQESASTCPVRLTLAWRAMCRAQNVPIEGPMVCVVAHGNKPPRDGSPKRGTITRQRLGGSTFERWCRDAAKDADLTVTEGERPRRFTPHMFRAGPITRAAELETPLPAIYEHFRFSKGSPVPLRYMRGAVKRTHNPARRVWRRRAV